jgi:PHD/YefM family antitoxin component YafN of YafNO toxin-antitoxin module
MEQTIVGVTDMRQQLKELIDALPERDVILIRHGRPVAVMVHPDRLDALIERCEDLEDRAVVAEARSERGDGPAPVLDLSRPARMVYGAAGKRWSGPIPKGGKA